MKQYDVKCPVCGTLNKNLYLEETNGWMECEMCGYTEQVPEYVFKPLLPVITVKNVLSILEKAT